SLVRTTHRHARRPRTPTGRAERFFSRTDHGALMNAMPSSPAVAVLGGGGFWCLDAVFRGLDGVLTVESGYAGGSEPNPSYDAVCTGRNGHAGRVKITFERRAVTF